LGPSLYYYLLSTNVSLNRYDAISRDTGYIEVPVFASSSRRVFVSEGGIFFPGITRKKTPKRRQSFPTLALARATRAPGATAPRPGDMASSSSDAHARRDAQRAALLAAPSPASEATYYAKLSAAAAASGAGHVRVERVTHGKGLVAARAFAKGERVLVEPPLVGMQQESNRADARVCGSCFRYVGSVGAQIARRLLAPAMRDAASAHGVDATWLRSLLRGDAALPEVAGFDARGLPSIVASPGDEDDEDAASSEAREVYCSATCASRAWRAHERFLSVGRGTRAAGGVAASRAFLEHAKDTNDIFILAAKVLLSVAVEAEEKRGQKEEEELLDASKGKTEVSTAFAASENDALAHLLAAWAPFSHGHKRVWWDAVARPEDVEAGEPERQFRESMREIATESLELLRRVVPEAVLERYPGLFCVDVFASVVGMFELNNLEIAVASPVEDYFLAVDALDDDTDVTAKSAKQVTNPLLDALDTSYCAPCEGTGFFALQSCLNSDCDPNVAPVKEDADVDGRCVLVAKRDIREGEELTMCYVDESMDVKERRAELRDYGFECACERCAREAEGRAQQRRGGKTK
jgi:hypothetical protein